jgi:endo-1,4-beta-xylanase
MKRLLFISFCLAISASIYSQSGPDNIAVQTDSNESLIKLAQKIRPDFYIGSASSGINPGSPDNEQLSAIFRNNFNIITIGIYMSGSQREQGKYNLERIDNLIDFATANNIKVYFHPMIGGAEYSPEWINKGTFTKDELSKIMRERITTILTRYGNKVQYIDVVNEAFTGTGMTPEGQFNWLKSVKQGEHIWMKTMGMYQGKKYIFPQYFVDAFRIAREVGDKNLKLIVNEWGNATTKSRRSQAFLTLIKAMREEGIPVDGGGIQLHCRLIDGKLYEWGEKEIPFDFDAFDAMLKQYEQAGIDIHITEFDIHLPENPTEADFQLQGKYYADILKHAIKSPAVKTFKTWGFTDKYSWKADGKDGHPLLLDENFLPKPAYIQQVEMLEDLAGVKK